MKEAQRIHLGENSVFDAADCLFWLGSAKGFYLEGGPSQRAEIVVHGSVPSYDAHVAVQPLQGAHLSRVQTSHIQSS